MNRQSFFKNLAALVGGAALAPVAKELSFWAKAPNPNNAHLVAGYIKVTRHMMKNIPHLLEYLNRTLPAVLLNEGQEA